VSPTRREVIKTMVAVGGMPEAVGASRADASRSVFELEFCTVARWKDGEIVEEKLFYDQVGFLRQIGVL